MRTRLDPASDREEERAATPAPAPPAAALLALQRTAGNQAVARILARDKGFDDVTAAGGVSEKAAPLVIKLPRTPRPSRYACSRRARGSTSSRTPRSSPSRAAPGRP